MKNIIARFIREEEGQDLIEYALLGTFVALAAYTGLSAAGGALDNWYGAMKGKVEEMCTGVDPDANCVAPPPEE